MRLVPDSSEGLRAHSWILAHRRVQVPINALTEN